MKTFLIAASALLTATVVTAPAAMAAEPAFGFTIQGPNGYIEIGARGHGRGYDVYDERDYRKHNRHGRRYWGGYCLDRKQIRRRLRHNGWRGLHNLRVRDRAFVINAWRRNGHEYRLRIDRCSGEILRAKHIGRDHGGRGRRGRL